MWIWIFQVFWWTPVNIWDQPRHMALVFVALFFFGAHHPLSRKRREENRHMKQTTRASPTTNARCMKWQQKMPLPAPRLVMLVGAWRHSYLVLVMRGDTFLAPRFCVSCWVRKLIRLFESFTGCPFHIFFGHLTD